jgi:hypothetical protein
MTIINRLSIVTCAISAAIASIAFAALSVLPASQPAAHFTAAAASASTTQSPDNTAWE